MEKKAIFLRVLLLAVILSVPSYFIYKDYLSGQEILDKSGADSNASTTPAVKDAKTSGVNIVPVSATSSSSGKYVLKYPMPDINKKWVIPAEYSADTMRIINERVATINESLKTNPEQYDKWIDLGGLRKLIGDYGEARAIWEFATITWPDSLVAYHNLGDIYHSYLKDYVKAELNMLKVIEIDPHYTSEYGLLRDLYGRLYGVGDSRVVGIVLRGLDKNPESVDLMVEVASGYKEAGDIVNAKRYYEMAIARAKELNNIGLQKMIEGEIKYLNI